MSARSHRVAPLGGKKWCTLLSRLHVHTGFCLDLFVFFSWVGLFARSVHPAYILISLHLSLSLSLTSFRATAQQPLTSCFVFFLLFFCSLSRPLFLPCLLSTSFLFPPSLSLFRLVPECHFRHHGNPKDTTSASFGFLYLAMLFSADTVMFFIIVNNPSKKCAQDEEADICSVPNSSRQTETRKRKRKNPKP